MCQNVPRGLGNASRIRPACAGKEFAYAVCMRRFWQARNIARGLLCGLLTAAGCADLHEAEPDRPNAETSGDMSSAGASASINADSPGNAAAPPPDSAAADAAALPLGVYHLRADGDPVNIELKGGSLNSYRWAMHGCDYGFENAGVWKQEGGRIVLSPSPGARTFQWVGANGIIQALQVALESGPEPSSLIARVEWDPVYHFESPELQHWDGGGRCSVCNPALFCSCTQEACVDPF